MIEVISPGLETTIQDYPGRIGYYSIGIPPSGPMDSLAFRMANILVGNSLGESGLEITATGPSLLFHDEAVIAVCGADMSPMVNSRPIKMWQSEKIMKGEKLSFGGLKDGGFRAYIAFRGSIDCPTYLGSKATYETGNLGGLHGKRLQRGEFLAIGRKDGTNLQRSIPPDLRPSYPVGVWEVEAMVGPQASPEFLTDADMAVLFSKNWKTVAQSNRVGYRLKSQKWQWARTPEQAGGHPSNVIEQGYPIGTINIAGDQPIILMVDAVSTGGYVCPATVISSSLWKVAQALPGRDYIKLREVDIEHALSLRKKTDELLTQVA